MKIHEYNEMMSYLTRPAVNRVGLDIGGMPYKVFGKKINVPNIKAQYVGASQNKKSVEEGFRRLQKWLKNPTPENWNKIFGKNNAFGLQLRNYLLGRTGDIKNMIGNVKGMPTANKLFDSINIKKLLSNSQINAINELTTGGKGKSLKSISAKTLGNLKYSMAENIETIKNFQNGDNWLRANPNPDAIDPVTGKNIYRERANAIRTMINEQSRLGGFPFGDNSEKKLWSNLYRASYRGDRIKIVGEFANGELPINPETGKVDWKMKNKNNVAAWKRVQFIDTQAPKQAVFKWGENFQKGDFKKQIDKVFGNGFFNKSTAAYDVQVATGSKRLSSGVTITHDLKNRILKVDLLTQDIKAGNKISNIPTKAEIDAYIKKKSPRFNLTEVHHPMGVGRDPYLTEPAFRFANRKLAKVEDAIRAGTMTLADAKVEIDNINKKIGPIRTYLDDGYYGSKGGATQKSILESANKMIKTLLSSADKPTIMAIRKALGCGLASGGRVGLQGGGNLLECPMAKFAQDPEGTLNIVGRAVPETRTPIINALKKFGMGTLKWGGRAFIGLTPIFAGMEIADASRKYEEGVPSGQIAMDAFGNWVMPGAGGMYKTYQDRKMMKDIASPQELAAMEKEDDRRYYNMLQEDPLREADYSKKLEETQTTPKEQLELFKLMEKQKATEYYNQQRRKGERAKLAEESIDTFSNFRDYAAASGGRVGFDEGSKPKSPSRRAFIKGITALAALPIVGKYFKLGKVLEKAQPYYGPIVEKVKGMPEWFPGLVKKLWNEGEDVTKQVAYGERQIVKRGTLEGGDDVDMIYHMDTGDVSISVTPKKGSHETTSGAYNKEYELDYTKGQADEMTRGKKPPDEFGVTEVEGRMDPNAMDIDWDANYTTVDDAMSDLTELEAFAKSKSTKQIHKKKGTKPKDVFPDYDPGDYDID